MNHVLRKSPSDATENMATYNNSELPLHPELIKELMIFEQIENTLKSPHNIIATAQ